MVMTLYNCRERLNDVSKKLSIGCQQGERMISKDQRANVGFSQDVQWVFPSENESDTPKWLSVVAKMMIDLFKADLFIHQPENSS